MAIIRWDGFDHYNDDTDLFRRDDFITYLNLAGISAISFPSGVLGLRNARALQFDADDTGGNPCLGIMFGQAVASAFVGLATQTIVGQDFLLRFYDSTSDVVQCSILFDSSNYSIKIYRGDFAAGTGVLVATSHNHIFRPLVRAYFEVWVTIGVKGSVKIYYNGRNLYNRSNINIQASSSSFAPQWDTMYVSANGAGLTVMIDDLYYGDTTITPGANPGNMPIGHPKVTTLFAVDGVSLSWTPLVAGKNALMVHEQAMDSDTTYNSTSALSDADELNFGLLRAVYTYIIGLQVTGAYRKLTGDTTVRKLEQFVKSGGITAYGDQHAMHETDYWYSSDVFLKDPNTNKAWFSDDINDATAGYKYKTSFASNTLGVIDSSAGAVPSGDFLLLNADLSKAWRLSQTDTSIRSFDAINGTLSTEISGATAIFGSTDYSLYTSSIYGYNWAVAAPDAVNTSGGLVGFTRSNLLHGWISYIDAGTLTNTATFDGITLPKNIFTLPFYKLDGSNVKHWTQLAFVVQQNNSGHFNKITICNLTENISDPYVLKGDVQTWSSSHSYSIGELAKSPSAAGARSIGTFRSLLNANTNHDPDNPANLGVWWQAVSFTGNYYEQMYMFCPFYYGVQSADFTQRGVNGWQEDGRTTWFTWGFNDSVPNFASRCRIYKWTIDWPGALSLSTLIDITPTLVDPTWAHGIGNVIVTTDLTDPTDPHLIVMAQQYPTFNWRVLCVRVVDGAVLWNVLAPTILADYHLPTMDAGPWKNNRWGYIYGLDLHLLNLTDGTWSVAPNHLPGTLPLNLRSGHSWFDDVYPSCILYSEWDANSVPTEYLVGWAADNATTWSVNFNRIWLGVGVPNPPYDQTLIPAVATGELRVSQICMEVLLVTIDRGDAVLPIYPNNIPGLTYNVKWTPQFYNMPTATTASGADIDIGLASSPLHNFELTYNFLRDKFDPAEFKRMFGFFLRLQGSRGRFLFFNPEDNYVTSELVFTGDGVTTFFGPITRTFGVGSDIGVEAIGYLDTTRKITVYLDGVRMNNETFSIDQTIPGNQRLKLGTPPASGVKITMDFGYMYYCKFLESQMTYEKFMDKLWLLNQVKIHSCRAGA